MHNDLVQIWNPVSTMSGEVDKLFYFLVLLSSFTAGLIIFFIIYFSAKYRKGAERKPASPIVVSTALVEAVWIGVPLVTFLFIFFWGAKVFFQQMDVPSGALQIYGVGKQWMWKFQHAEGNREINELHVPVGVPVQVTLISQDVIHSFFVPAFRVKMDVLPDRYTHVWFEIKKPGEYHLFCAEYCGANHSVMGGKVIAMPQAEYETWLEGGKKESMAYRGAQVFERFGCVQCHRRDSLIAAPAFEGLYGGKIHLANGQTILADEAYIRESILYPERQLGAGYQNLMPTFKDQLTEEQVLELIAYIKSLGKSPGSAVAPEADNVTK